MVLGTALTSGRCQSWKRTVRRHAADSQPEMLALRLGSQSTISTTTSWFQ